MLKRLPLAGALVAMIALPGVASAGAPTGGCLVDFETWNTADIPNSGTFYSYQSADLNGDGQTCVRLLRNQPDGARLHGQRGAVDDGRGVIEGPATRPALLRVPFEANVSPAE